MNESYHFSICSFRPQIVRAHGLFVPNSHEYKEALNPVVTVEWCNIRKTTRVIEGTSDPYWDEEVFFKIPDADNT